MYFAVIAIIGLFIMAYLHEMVHVQIYNDYGVDSEIKIFDMEGFGMVTIGYNVGDKCNDTCQLAHEINEVVGYHLMAIYFLLFVGFFFILIKLEGR